MRNRELITAGMIAGAAACSRDGAGPSASDLVIDQVVANVSADAAARDVEFMHGPGGLLGFGFHRDRLHFDCADGSAHGLTVIRSCIFKNANGDSQPTYDTLTTASVSVHLTVTGTVDRDHFSETVNDVRDFVVTGLAGRETERIWNGTGSGSSTPVRDADDATVQFELTHHESETDVVIPVRPTDQNWPRSGTLQKHVTVKITGGSKDGTTETRDVTITFDGTQFATVTVNGDTFQVDLASRGRPERHGHH
jgi:hypothetical protein